MSSPQRKRIRKAVYHHDWSSLEEWVATLGELAELDDHDIEDLVRRAANDAVDGDDDDA